MQRLSEGRVGKDFEAIACDEPACLHSGLVSCLHATAMAAIDIAYRRRERHGMVQPNNPGLLD